MNKYETIFVVNSSRGEETTKGLVEKFTSLIGSNAEVESINEWGNRKFAYPIEDLTEGYYVLVKFAS
jgi:small subunit ribosomal protein S6